MFENDNGNGFFAGNDLDLGSASSDFGGFTPIDSTEADAIFGSAPTPPQAPTPTNPVGQNNTAPVQRAAPNVNAGQPVAPVNNVNAVNVEEANNEKVTDSDNAQPQAAAGANSPEQAEVPNLFEAAVAKAEEKQAETTKNSLTDKLPYFVHGSAKEEIVDTSKTFEQLRLEKAEDFPELDEGDNVSWKVTYGTISKVVTNKKDTIASFKKKIEESKAFVDALKKTKPTDEIICKVSPTITAKKKGIMSSYKGLYSTVEEARSSGKVISFVPSEDGRVFEVRNSKMGTFIAPTEKVTSFKKVRAGFIPALPKIPYKMLSEIIAFFKSYVDKQRSVEALTYIYWSFADSKYYAYVPKQVVGKARVDSSLPDMDEDKFMLVMEIHSHNTMPGFFSPIDDDDEKATRLYSVVGKLDNIFPEIKTRMSCGGKFVEIDPSEVFEGFEGTFPETWSDAVVIRKHRFSESEASL